ncbi:MAG: hypothetical protein J1F04_08780 [Oscillospiraceae bacterium]|nr:hypothetical protein [Oscillospiraceae bacterium]
MEYIEIIFGGIETSAIDSFIKDTLQIKKQDIINSHFYSELQGDFEYFDELSLKDYFSVVNTANLFVKSLRIVQDFYEIMCVISSDLKDVEVTCSFSAEQFHKERENEIADWFQQLCSKEIIAFASLGYECDDTPIIVVSK